MSEARWAGATRGTRSSWVSERKDGSQVAVEDEEDNFEVDSAMLAPLQGLSLPPTSPPISPFLPLPLSPSHTPSLSMSLSLPPSRPPSPSLLPLWLRRVLSLLCCWWFACVSGPSGLVFILLSCALAEFHADQKLTGGGRLRAAVKRRQFLKSLLTVTFSSKYN